VWIGGPINGWESSRAGYQSSTQSLPAGTMWKGSPGLMTPIVVVSVRQLARPSLEM
jgi:hypothetical protein